MSDEPCSCGRGAPRIGRIEGRVQSIIQGTDGRYLPGTFFSHYFKDLSHAIRRYRVVQERRDAIRLELCKAGRYSDAVLEEVLATLRAHLGERMQIEVVLRDDIALIRTGKHLASVSHLPVDLQTEHAPVVVRPGGNGQ